MTPGSRQAVAGTPIRGQGVPYQHQSSSGASKELRIVMAMAMVMVMVWCWLVPLLGEKWG